MANTSISRRKNLVNALILKKITLDEIEFYFVFDERFDNIPSSENKHLTI